jgi:hypothetical protein
MRAAIFAITTILGLAVCESATAQPSVWILGIGNESCANWLSNAYKEDEGRVWIMGFWSGLNLFNNADHTVGRANDVKGVLGEVKRICIARPSLELGRAAREVYGMMMTQHR